MLVSIVIPTYNGQNTLGEVFAKIRLQNTDKEVQVICVDSGSVDQTLKICRKNQARIISVAKKEFNHGLTRDKAIGLTKSEYIILLTQDAVPADESWLENLIQPISGDEKVAAVYSRQIPRLDCHPLAKYHLSFYIGCSRKRRIQEIRDRKAYHNLSQWNKYALIHFANVSSCIRREVWENFPFGKWEFGEDLAWAKRVLEAGYKIIYEPSSAVIHSHNYSCSGLFKRLYLDHQNLNRVIGLESISSIKQTIAGALPGIKPLWVFIDKEENLNRPAKFYWKCYAVPYSINAVLGQYLGARSGRWLRKNNTFLRLLNAALRQGI